MSGLIVDEQYVYDMKSFIEAYGEVFDTTFEKYMKIMQDYNNRGVVKGATAEAINQYIITALELKGCVDDISEVYGQNFDKYIKDIDKADRYIY